MPAVDVHRGQLSALDLVQHRLTGDAQRLGGLVEGEPALGHLGHHLGPQGTVDADVIGLHEVGLPATARATELNALPNAVFDRF